MSGDGNNFSEEYLEETVGDLDGDGRADSFHRNAPDGTPLELREDRDRDGTPDPVDGVIELGAGEAARLGIEVGDGVSIERL